MNIFNSILQSAGINTDGISNVLIEGCDPILPSPFLIGEAGAAALAAVGYAASELQYLRTGQQHRIKMNVYDAAIAQRSHEYLKILASETPALWNPISGFYQTQDNRWIQFHCNFPHHLQGVIALLGCPAEKSAVVSAVKNWQADDLEQRLAEQGLCASMLRSEEEWASHPQAHAVKQLPLLEIIKLADSQPESLLKEQHPLSGIKMLDLSRVIAGPVCGKTLAEQGATVLRIDSPHLPEVLPLAIDTGFGKYSAHLDLNQRTDKQRLWDLIKSADIFLQAYRPGGMVKLGFSPQALAAQRPGIICIELSAYSHVGPWSQRHGYDSLVQTASGIAYEQGKGQPKHLPAQSLDYITGYLAAFGAMEALRRRTIEGGSYLVRLSLLQTAEWFKALGRVVKDVSQCRIPLADEISQLLTQTETIFGKVEHLVPILNLSESVAVIPRAVVPIGSDPAQWPCNK